MVHSLADVQSMPAHHFQYRSQGRKRWGPSEANLRSGVFADGSSCVAGLATSRRCGSNSIFGHCPAQLSVSSCRDLEVVESERQDSDMRVLRKCEPTDCRLIFVHAPTYESWTLFVNPMVLCFSTRIYCIHI